MNTYFSLAFTSLILILTSCNSSKKPGPKGNSEAKSDQVTLEIPIPDASSFDAQDPETKKPASVSRLLDGYSFFLEAVDSDCDPGKEDTDDIRKLTGDTIRVEVNPKCDYRLLVWLGKLGDSRLALAAPNATVRPIILENCTAASGCHTSGDPRAFDSDQAVPAVRAGTMPKGGRTLTAAEKEAFLAWGGAVADDKTTSSEDDEEKDKDDAKKSDKSSTSDNEEEEEEEDSLGDTVKAYFKSTTEKDVIKSEDLLEHVGDSIQIEVSFERTEAGAKAGFLTKTASPKSSSSSDDDEEEDDVNSKKEEDEDKKEDKDKTDSSSGSALKFADVKPIIDSKCNNCHDSQVPILTSESRVNEQINSVVNSIKAGTMPKGSGSVSASDLKKLEDYRDAIEN